MPLSTFPIPNNDKRFSFPNRFGIPDNIFNAIVQQSQLQIDASVGSLVVVNDADYTIGSNDGYVLYKQLTMARTLTLPAASSNTNRVITIAHGGDGAFLINLSILVRQSQSTSINSLGTGAERYMIASDGTDWWIIL